MEAPIELETFIKNGLKLLRRTKDQNSIKVMFKHYEDAIQEQYGGNRQPTNAAKKLAVPTILLSKELGIEQTEIVDDESSSSSSSSSPLPTTSKSIVEVCTPPPPTITLEQAKSDPVINIDSDSEMETDNMESYSCCVCKDSFVNIGNSLVECLDCHSMYHQNCHTPPITDINLNDPRIVWYCSNCRQRDSQKVERSSGKESKKSSSKSSTGAKSEKSSSSKTSHGAKGSSSKSKSSSANSSPKHYLPSHPTVMSAAEKRVQMMKKKAAKKSEKKK